MPDDVMDDLRAAMAQAAPETAPETAPDVTEAPPADTEAPTAPVEAVANARDEKGRFAPKADKPVADAKAEAQPAKAEAKDTVGPGTQAGSEGQSLAPAAPKAEPTRAPQSWKPQAREHWEKLPQEVQQEALRLDREVRQTLQATAEVRKLGEGFQQTLAPYRALLTDEPLKVVGNLLQTAAALQTGPVPVKAQMLAKIIRDYNVPIDALDAALSGQTPPAGHPQGMDPNAIAQQVQQQVMQHLAHQRAQATSQRTAQEVDTFAQGKEFFDDVREDMGDLIDMAAKRGRTMSLDEAYSKAVQMNPDLAKVLSQREAAKAAANAQASTQKAKAAASSVKTQPAGIAPPRGNGSVRDDSAGGNC